METTFISTKKLKSKDPLPNSSFRLLALFLDKKQNSHRLSGGHGSLQVNPQPCFWFASFGSLFWTKNKTRALRLVQHVHDQLDLVAHLADDFFIVAPHPTAWVDVGDPVSGWTSWDSHPTRRGPIQRHSQIKNSSQRAIHHKGKF